MKVAIWGSYSYGNYGDELMALVFAMRLKQLGAQPVVYGLHEPLAHEYSIECTRSSRDLLEGASFCVFGGGSLLSKKHHGSGAYSRNKEREYKEFLWALERERCPLYFLSIGGDGTFGSEIEITGFREALLKSDSCRLATVRQRADAPRMYSSFGIPAQYFPDVLLGIEDFWSVDVGTKEREELHVGLNLPRSYRHAARLLSALGRVRGRVVYHYISTVRPGKTAREPSNELIPQAESASVRRHIYDNPTDTLAALKSIDVIITTKLHIGLTAVALGTPYICVGHSLKSKAFLHSVGASDAYWGDVSEGARKLRVLGTALSKKRMCAARNWFDADTLDTQKRESRGHLCVLESVYERHRQCAPQVS